MDVRSRLHQARLARGLALDDVRARTALNLSIVEKIDAGEFDQLPPGLYARAYIRAFATEVGLDPISIVADLEMLLPQAPDPFPVLSEVRSEPETTLHLQLARCSAAMLDALLLLVGVLMPVILLASWSSGVELQILLADAGGALGAVCALPVGLYFLLFDGIGGGTPGCRTFGLGGAGTRVPLKLPEILRRAVLH